MGIVNLDSTKRKVRVILMGAGASSLNFSKKVEEQMQNLEITCYKKNSDISERGSRTDILVVHARAALNIAYLTVWNVPEYSLPSVNYYFTWKLKLWSHYY